MNDKSGYDVSPRLSSPPKPIHISPAATGPHSPSQHYHFMREFKRGMNLELIREHLPFSPSPLLRFSDSPILHFASARYTRISHSRSATSLNLLSTVPARECDFGGFFK